MRWYFDMHDTKSIGPTISREIARALSTILKDDIRATPLDFSEISFPGSGRP